jgi:hypothetical protein
MTNVKREEHEGLMLLFMTTFFLLAATTAAPLKKGFALSARHDCFGFSFLGRRTLFFGNILPPLRYHCLFLRHHGIEEFFFSYYFID